MPGRILELLRHAGGKIWRKTRVKLDYFGETTPMYAYKCSDIMSVNVECCVPVTSVEQVAQLMKSAGVGAIPIVADLQSRHLVGIVTDRDLAMRVVAEGRDPATTAVGDVMTRGLLVCYPNDDIRALLGLMEEYRIRRVPVVDNSGNIIGLISAVDVARRLKDAPTTAHLFQVMSRPRQAPLR